MILYISEVHLVSVHPSVCGELMEFCWSWWGCWCCVHSVFHWFACSAAPGGGPGCPAGHPHAGPLTAASAGTALCSSLRSSRRDGGNRAVIYQAVAVGTATPTPLLVGAGDSEPAREPGSAPWLRPADSLGLRGGLFCTGTVGKLHGGTTLVAATRSDIILERVQNIHQLISAATPSVGC